LHRFNDLFILDLYLIKAARGALPELRSSQT
jgi:hypothetical protein